MWPSGEAEIIAYLKPMVTDFARSCCADTHFLDEFGCGELGKFAARIWESMLYSRFKALGWNVTGADAGPDFQLETPQGSVLVEAVTAGPGNPDGSGLPKQWQERAVGVATEVPIDRMLLRWTNALSEKLRKHLKDVECAQASPSVPFVIAINSCLLGADEHGISGLPLAVMAVLPFGNPAATVDVKTGEVVGGWGLEWRNAIVNANDAQVPTDSFLNPDYDCVSAIVGCSGFYVSDADREKFCGQPPYFVVHNPKAKNPLPQPWLPGAIEYSANEVSSGKLEIKKIQ